MYLEKASHLDVEFFYDLQKIPGVRRFFRNPRVPTWEEHEEWFFGALSSDLVELWKIVEEDGRKRVGMVRLDKKDGRGSLFEISVIVDPSYSGKGIGVEAVRRVCERNSGSQVLAVVHSKNIPSKKLFKKVGFSHIETEGNFEKYIYS